MITLVSRWKLRSGCPAVLASALEELGREVAAQEPGTWMYLVNLPARPPLDAGNHPRHPPPPHIEPVQQMEVVFLEVYEDARAFAAHVNGPVFTSFLRDHLQHFYEDPDKPGWPSTDTTFYDRLVTVGRPGPGTP